MRKVGLLAVVALLGLVALQGNPFRQSPNEHVIEDVKDEHKNAPWMDHVDEWGSTLGISVETDYQDADLDSYAAAYDICLAVKSAYAKGATDLPNVRIYGLDTSTKIRVDGSKDEDNDRKLIASSMSSHDYKCGIIPVKERLAEAKNMGVPVFGR